MGLLQQLKRRRRRLVIILLAVSSGSFIMYMLLGSGFIKTNEVYRFPKTTGRDGVSVTYDYGNSKPVVRLAVVACDTRIEEAFTMLKSAVIFSQHANLHVIGVSDGGNQRTFAGVVEKLRVDAWNLLRVRITYEIYPAWFPEKDHDEWKDMFKPCSTQRLFFPTMFPHIDSLMYLDSDTLFLSNTLNLWNHFERMDKNQLAAIAPEDEPLANGWYNMKSEIPYWKPGGLNAGIMLMNLTRMREFHFEERAVSILRNYNSTIVWADQDILNIMFYFNPERLYELSCVYNVKAQNCKCVYDPPGDCSCHAIRKTGPEAGVAILHGNREMFHKCYHSSSSDFFHRFYEVFLDYRLPPHTSAPAVKSNLANMYHKLYAVYEEQEQQCQEATAHDVLQQFEHYLTTIKDESSPPSPSPSPSPNWLYKLNV